MVQACRDWRDKIETWTRYGKEINDLALMSNLPERAGGYHGLPPSLERRPRMKSRSPGESLEGRDQLDVTRATLHG
jgi:hypothetical protein